MYVQRSRSITTSLIFGANVTMMGLNLGVCGERLDVPLLPKWNPRCGAELEAPDALDIPKTLKPWGTWAGAVQVLLLKQLIIGLTTLKLSVTNAKIESCFHSFYSLSSMVVNILWLQVQVERSHDCVGPEIPESSEKIQVSFTIKIPCTLLRVELHSKYPGYRHILKMQK